jgi:excinuclease ABC subunit C
MHEKARLLEFEAAARIRGQIEALCSLGNSDACVGRQQELEDLRRKLGLKKLPLRIEAFDISNVSGKEATGSMVSFYKGVADKDRYRRFRIRTVEGIDDYAMLKEVVSRRYRRVRDEQLPLPDLILIDGGRAHLQAARAALNATGLRAPMASIAKDRENVYVEGRKDPLTFSRDTPALNLLRRVRDEAHRFALKYHHLLHKKKILGRGGA